MKTAYAPLVHAIAYYDKLLTRYARFITRNETIALTLVKKVLEDQYDIDELKPSDHLRNKLKTGLRVLCLGWKLMNEKVDFAAGTVAEKNIEKPSSLN